MAEAPPPQPVEEESDPLSIFAEEWQYPISGLSFLGQLVETVHFCGHTFTFRTLLPQDKFAISSVLQPYRNTIMEVDVYQAAHVAAALIAVDEDEDFCPQVGPNIEMFIRARLNWLAKNLYPPTVEFLWGEHRLLELKAAGAIGELDRLSKGSQPEKSPPWLDSLIAQGSSPAETDLNTPLSTPSNFD